MNTTFPGIEAEHDLPQAHLIETAFIGGTKRKSTHRGARVLFRQKAVKAPTRGKRLNMVPLASQKRSQTRDNLIGFAKNRGLTNTHRVHPASLGRLDSSDGVFENHAVLRLQS